MGIDSKIEFENLHREENNNVAGSVALKVYGEIAGYDFNKTLEKKEFNFPREGEQEVYKLEFKVKALNFKITAKIYEKPAGQCCIQGHVHVDAPVGGGIGKDLDPNCHPIP